MAYLIPNEGEERLLLELLDGGTTREAWILKLFKNNFTIVETMTASDLTAVSTSDWPGYTNRTLTRTVNPGTTWGTPASGTPTNAWSAEASVAESAYGAAPQSWTNDHASNVVSVYGYFIVGATTGLLIAVEKFNAVRILNPNDKLEFTPRFGHN